VKLKELCSPLYTRETRRFEFFIARNLQNTPSHSLDQGLAYFKEGIPAQIDLRKGDFNTLFGPQSETRTLTDDQPYVLRPQKLVLGKTLERVELPLMESEVCLAPRVEGKSAYARCGFPGFCRRTRPGFGLLCD
jgi:deoxycytidine triphosphate deaminase